MNRRHGPVPNLAESTPCPWRINPGPPPPTQDQSISPPMQFSSYTQAQLSSIKKLYPWTESLEESLIHMIPLHKFVEMTPKPQKRDSSRQGMRDRLVDNAMKLDSPAVPTTHLDDSGRNLCKIRVDRYPRTSVAEFMVAAKKLMPTGGIPAVDTYDMDYLGLGSTVTDRGWIEIHNPGSEFLNLKMFSRSNSLAASEGSRTSFSILSAGEALGVGDNLKEIANMGEFKQSLRSYLAASYFATPFYPAPLALVMFLEHHRYMEKYLPQYQAKTLTKFVNQVIARNAKSWRTADVPPLSVEDLWRTWTHFCADNSINGPADYASPLPAHMPRQDFRKNSAQTKKALFSSSAPPPLFQKNVPLIPRSSGFDFCIRYNQGSCPSQNRSSCILKYGGGSRTLKHICSKCGKNHPAFKFHQ